MRPPPKRAYVLRLLFVGTSLAVASAFSASAGCSDLLSAASNDGGAPAAGDDGGGGPPTDAAGIFLDDTSVASEAGDASDAAALVNCAVEDASFGPPNDLACTGLYSSFATKAIAASVHPYDPALHLWADGAAVARWIYLPAGQTIDTSDMNEWQFPVGTKAWQEFQISGQRVETRFYWKRGASDWVRGTYAWSSDQTQATYLATGATNVGGSTYEIPTVAQCDSCHLGRVDRLLGFEAVSLSQAAATGLNLSTLVTQKLLTKPPTGPLTLPDDGTQLAAPALGWLHANCGTSCHNGSPGAAAGSTGLLLRLDVTTDGGAQTLGAYTSTNTYLTAVNVPASTQPYAGLGWKRITPHDTFALDGGLEGTSLIPYAAERRNQPAVQMPPIDTHVPDLPDIAAVKQWITNGSFP